MYTGCCVASTGLANVEKLAPRAAVPGHTSTSSNAIGDDSPGWHDWTDPVEGVHSVPDATWSEQNSQDAT